MFLISMVRIREIELEMAKVLPRLDKRILGKDIDLILWALLNSGGGQSYFFKIQRMLDIPSEELAAYFQLLEFCNEYFKATVLNVDSLLEFTVGDPRQLAQRIRISPDQFIEWVEEKIRKYEKLITGEYF